MNTIENLLLNMASGLLPENLSASEVLLLEKELGEKWFESLGYTEAKYDKPKRKK